MIQQLETVNEYIRLMFHLSGRKVSQAQENISSYFLLVFMQEVNSMIARVKRELTLRYELL